MAVVGLVDGAGLVHADIEQIFVPHRAADVVSDLVRNPCVVKISFNLLHFLRLCVIAGAKLYFAALRVVELRAVAHGVHAYCDAVEDVAAGIFCREDVFAGDAVHERNYDSVRADGGRDLVHDGREVGAFDGDDHEVRGGCDLSRVLEGKGERLVVDRVSIILVAGEAGAVHDEFDVFRAVGLLEPGAEEHAEGAEAVDGGGFDRLHRGPFCGGKRPLGWFAAVVSIF